MSRSILMSFGAVLLLAADPAREDETKKDREILQGTWKNIYSETEGKGFEPTNELTITFEKDCFVERAAGHVACRGFFKLDASRKPKRMDHTITENKLIPESKGMKIYCIYELAGDRVKIRYPPCGCFFSTWRPKDFSTKRESTWCPLLDDIAQGGSLEIYKKVKP